MRVIVAKYSNHNFSFFTLKYIYHNLGRGGLAYTYADTRAKHIDLKTKSDGACNRRVVVRAQHPTASLIKQSGLVRRKFKEAFESVVNIRERYFRLQREIYR